MVCYERESVMLKKFCLGIWGKEGPAVGPGQKEIFPAKFLLTALLSGHFSWPQEDCWIACATAPATKMESTNKKLCGKVWWEPPREEAEGELQLETQTYNNGFPFAREIAVHICSCSAEMQCIAFLLMLVALETNHLFRIAAFPDTARKWWEGGAV